MNELKASYQPDGGQLILEGRPAGLAGEAGLVLAGADLAFDRSDGHLVRVAAEAGGKAATTLMTRLFGVRAARVLDEVAASPAAANASRPRALSPEPVLCAALSSLARLDAVRDTSPVPRRSPWWAAETAVLAEQAGLHDLARAESGRLRDSVALHRPCTAEMDVAAEVEALEKDSVRQGGLNWVLDPAHVPAGLFRPGLSPHSDLLVRPDGGAGLVTVEAVLAEGADAAAVGRCQARLVDPAVRRVLAQADCHLTGSRIRAELPLPFPLDELDEAWIEVAEGPHGPVLSTKAHLIRRALRWADAALRAERAPAGLAPASAAGDWATLAAIAWQRCRRDWAAAGHPARAKVQPVPGVLAPGPAYLAEVVGY